MRDDTSVFFFSLRYCCYCSFFEVKCANLITSVLLIAEFTSRSGLHQSEVHAGNHPGTGCGHGFQVRGDNVFGEGTLNPRLYLKDGNRHHSSSICSSPNFMPQVENFGCFFSLFLNITSKWWISLKNACSYYSDLICYTLKYTSLCHVLYSKSISLKPNKTE